MSPHALILAALCFLCFFWRLGSVGLFDFNEGLYVSAAREMRLRGDFITPRANGVFFFDKPPLALWLSALAFRALGVSELAARLPVALAATLLVFLTWRFGARHFGERAGFYGAAILALSPLFVGTARQMTMDIHQSLWFAAALFVFYRGWELGERGRWWFYLAWASVGLSFLAKSVPGLFALIVALLFLLVEERFRGRSFFARFLQTRPLEGFAILAAVVAPWHLLAYAANGPLFYQKYWLQHHVGLLTGADFDHVAPFWYYIPALLAGMFPWSLFLPAAMRGIRLGTAQDDAASARRFLLIWAATVFLLFSLMTSKLVSYLLPMYAAAALLVGDWLSRVTEARSRHRSFTWSVTVVAAAAVGIAVAAAVAFVRFTRPGVEVRGDFPPAAAWWVLPGLALAAAGSVAGWILALRGRGTAAVAALILGMTAFMAVAVEWGLRSLDEQVNRPLRTLALAAGKKVEQGAPLAIHIAGPRRPSVFFYLPDSAFLGKPLPKELGEGILLERGEKEPILDFLKENRSAFVLTDVGRARELMAEAAGLEIEQESGKWVLLRAKDAQ